MPPSHVLATALVLLSLVPMPSKTPLRFITPRDGVRQLNSKPIDIQLFRAEPDPNDRLLVVAWSCDGEPVGDFPVQIDEYSAQTLPYAPHPIRLYEAGTYVFEARLYADRNGRIHERAFARVVILVM